MQTPKRETPQVLVNLKIKTKRNFAKTYNLKEIFFSVFCRIKYYHVYISNMYFIYK